MTWSFINGWKRNVNRVRASAYLLGLLILCQQVLAEESQADQPPMELLEFLGSAEMIDGEWLDPLYMMDLQASEPQAGQQEKQDNEY